MVFASRGEAAPAPLKRVDLLILTVLASGERHGYGIRQDIVEHTAGGVLLDAGNLYRAIRRLEDDGFVEESDRRPAREADDERRRYYRISTSGRRALSAELSRMRELVRLAERQGLLPPEPAR